MQHLVHLPQSERTLRTFRERLTESETAVKERLAEIHENSASYQACDLAGSLMDMKAGETFSGTTGLPGRYSA